MTWDLRLGSCLDPVTGLASLADDSVDHVITDPPYDEHTHKAGRRGCTGVAEKESSNRAQYNRTRELGFPALTAEDMAESALQFARVSRRWTLAFCSVEMVSDWKRCLVAAGLKYIRTCIWHKLGSAPQFTGDRPAQAFECIVVAHRPGRTRWNAHGKHGYYAHPIVLNRGAGEVRQHTTQKPLALMRELVSDFTDPGELVADAYAGSATTLLACMHLDRKSIGWELSPIEHTAALRRLRGDEAKPRPEQPSLFDRRPA